MVRGWKVCFWDARHSKWRTQVTFTHVDSAEAYAVSFRDANPDLAVRVCRTGRDPAAAPAIPRLEQRSLFDPS